MKWRGIKVTILEWVQVLVILIILTGAGIMIYSLVIDDINECTSNPLNYSIQKFFGKNDYKYVEMNLYENIDDRIPSNKIKINIETKEIITTIDPFNFSIKK